MLISDFERPKGFLEGNREDFPTVFRSSFKHGSVLTVCNEEIVLQGSSGGVVNLVRPPAKPLAENHEAVRGQLPIIQRVRDTRGKFLTSSLFYETVNTNARYSPLYTLREQDRPDLPSARRIYLELADPTEYAPAMALLGSWEHWSHLCGLSWFKPYVESWRAELRAKLKSRAVDIAKTLAVGNDATALSAAKWLHAAISTKNTGGRPKKEAKSHPADSADTDSDFARITEQEAEDG